MDKSKLWLLGVDGMSADRGVHRINDRHNDAALSPSRHLTTHLELLSYTFFKHRCRPLQGRYLCIITTVVDQLIFNRINCTM